MSFFEDDDELPPTTVRPRRPPAPRAGARPRPRRGTPSDHHAVVVRRRLLAGVVVVVLILIILLIAGLVRSGNREGLEKYARGVSAIEKESTEQVSAPFFQALTDAGAEQRPNVEQRLNELRELAKSQAAKAGALSVPEGLSAAQRDFLMALHLREEGVAKVGGRISVALGGQGESATAYKEIAGAMETFLTSDVIYTQRVVPLVEETLHANEVSGLTLTSESFLPNLGWLEPVTATARISGHASAQGSAPVSGSQGSALVGVSVGSNSLAPAPELNHVHSGANPTFDVKVENAGSSEETNVTVTVTVTAADKQYSASRTLEKIATGHSATAEVPVEGVPLNTGAKVSVYVEPVPGETDLEDNKATYEAVFS